MLSKKTDCLSAVLASFLLISFLRFLTAMTIGYLKKTSICEDFIYFFFFVDLDLEELTLPSSDSNDVEDEESTPIPLTPDNCLNSSIVPANEQPTFINAQMVII